MTRDELRSQSWGEHADHPLRRYRLRHAAIRSGMRALGHARTDEFHQSRAWRLRHGGRLLHRHSGQPPRYSFCTRIADRFFVYGAALRIFRTHALCPCLLTQPSRPGAVHYRAGLHVGRGGRLHHGLVATIRANPRSAARPVRSRGHRHGQISPAHHRHLRSVDDRLATDARQNALRQPPARGRGRSARRARTWHQCWRSIRHHFCVRLRPCRSGRRTWRGNTRARPDLSAQIHDLFFDRGEARRLRHLRCHDCRADLAAAGPVRPRRGAVTPMGAPGNKVALYLKRRARWSPLEIAFWFFAFATIWLFPGKYLILKDTAILALFALSLDLILGYAGIISLGQAAFFGLAGYFAGLVAKHGIITEPVIALVCAGLLAALLGFITSFLVLRGSDLTRLMVTLGVSLMLGELANRYSDITGGADGLQGVEIEPIFGRFRFDLFGHNGYVYCLIVLFVCFVIVRRIVYSPFGLSLRSIKGNTLRAAAIGVPVKWRLVSIYTVSAGVAGIAGALLTQTTAFCSLDVFSLERSADLLLVLIIGGTGYLYGGLIGAVIYKFLQDWIANLTPQYWQFWIGLVLVVIVLIGRERMAGWVRLARSLLARLTARLAPRLPALGGAGSEGH